MFIFIISIASCRRFFSTMFVRNMRLLFIYFRSTLLNIASETNFKSLFFLLPIEIFGLLHIYQISRVCRKSNETKTKSVYLRLGSTPLLKRRWNFKVKIHITSGCLQIIYMLLGFRIESIVREKGMLLSITIVYNSQG